MTNKVTPRVASGTATQALYSKVVFVAQSLAPLHNDFDSLMEELESDRTNTLSIQRADKWIADNFYGGDIETMRSIRQRRGHSQAALASLVGTSQAQIAKIENGKANPQLTTIMRLTKALRTDPNTLCAALGNSLVKEWRHG